jgi:thioredoxin-related protein
MKKLRILQIALFLFVGQLTAQESVSLYHPDADAMKEIQEAIITAQTSEKHVLIQVGYNQCPWCVKLHQFIRNHHEIDSLIQADFVVLKVNYNKENRNHAAMQFLGYPQRFGFPVLVVLDEKGNRIHTQNTAYLEKKQSYDPKEIISFLKAWNRKAVSPDTYPMK